MSSYQAILHYSLIIIIFIRITWQCPVQDGNIGDFSPHLFLYRHTKSKLHGTMSYKRNLETIWVTPTCPGKDLSKSLSKLVGETKTEFSSVQSLNRVWLFATPWIAARQASLSITNSRSLLKLMSIESVMPSSHLILCRPLLLLPSIPPSIRVFSNESMLRMRWPKYWSFSFSISPSNEHAGLISFRMDWLDLLNTTSP